MERFVTKLRDAMKADLKHDIEALPSAQIEITEIEEQSPGQNKMSNKEWIDFLSEQFSVSRTIAREMLHDLMRWKRRDNFNKQFSGCK